jgi:hypothetical protein
MDKCTNESETKDNLTYDTQFYSVPTWELLLGVFFGGGWNQGAAYSFRIDVLWRAGSWFYCRDF